MGEQYHAVITKPSRSHQQAKATAGIRASVPRLARATFANPVPYSAATRLTRTVALRTGSWDGADVQRCRQREHSLRINRPASKTSSTWTATDPQILQECEGLSAIDRFPFCAVLSRALVFFSFVLFFALFLSLPLSSALAPAENWCSPGLHSPPSALDRVESAPRRLRGAGGPVSRTHIKSPGRDRSGHSRIAPDENRQFNRAAEVELGVALGLAATQRQCDRFSADLLWSRE